MSILKLLGAVRTDEHTVKVIYFHVDTRMEIVVEWNNIHPENGEIVGYDLQTDCLSRCEFFNAMIEDAISEGESMTEDCDLYLELRDTFDARDCEGLK